MYNTVELCIIVRDEALNLGRCLASVRPWVTRCIVVDTGSCDETVAVARAAGCDVVHHGWQDHFADARNVGLAGVTGDWVLVLDADEVLVVEDALAWHQALHADGLIGYRLKIFNVAEGGTLRSVVRSSPRLFRFHPDLRFKGRIHETVTGDLLRFGGSVADLDGVGIKHVGYAQQFVDSRNKLERNLMLSTIMVKESPRDPLAWFHLANVSCLLACLTETADALLVMDQLANVGLVLPPEYVPRWFQLGAWVAEKQGALSRAVAILTEGLARVGPDPELLYERGKIHAALGYDADALADFRQCVETKVPPLGVERMGLRGFLVYTEMMAIYVRAGKLELAAECARLASRDPNCPAAEAACLRNLIDTWCRR